MMMRQREGLVPGRTSTQELATATPGKRTLTEQLPSAVPAWEVIQRQEYEGAAPLADTLQRIAGEVPAADQAALRALSAELEAMRAAVDAAGDAALVEQFLQTQDALLRRFQGDIVGHADATLQAWSTAEGDARTAQRAQYLRESGYPFASDAIRDWCGMFTNAQFRAAGFAPAFHQAFNHSDDVPQFFQYVKTSRSPGMIRPHGNGHTDGVPLHGYHAERGSERSWVPGGAIGDDLRPGDVITVDWDEDGQADHICIVAAYLPGQAGAPATVVTIDGNSFGAKKPGDAAPAFDGTDEMAAFGEMTTSDVSTSQYVLDGANGDRGAMLPDGRGTRTMTIFGRGRPSVVDFETGHGYPGFEGAYVPDEGPASPILRAGTAAVTAADPGAAFDAATTDAPGELPYRAEMQARFGADFSSVQSYAGKDLSALGARAATRGEQIAFASPSPDKQTVVHELTHVMQSRQGRVGGAPVSDPGDASEHEARAAEHAATGDGPISVGAAASAGIHRQEETTSVVPPAVHPAERGNHQGFAINWNDYRYFISEDYVLPVNNTAPGSIREVYEFFLLRYLARELPEQVSAYDGVVPAEEQPSLPGRHERHAAVEGITAVIQTRMHELIAAGETNAAEQIRVRLFASNEHALADALLIPGSTRHAQTRDAEGKITETWCNVFAFDVVTAMGGYLPRQWWTTDMERRLLAGEPAPAQASPHQIAQLRANDLYDWMLRWGVPHFGWIAVDTAEQAQAAADAGQIAIILASTGDEAVAGSPGHVSVVMASTTDRKPPTAAETGGASVPLQAQAGGENFATNAAGADVARIGRRTWWTDGIFAEHEASGSGFFVYAGGRDTDGFGDLAVQPPEAMGTVLPAG